MSFAVLKAAHRHSDILNAMRLCKHAGFVCVYVHKLWGFFYFFFIIWCRDAMNSLATVTMEHFDSWLCLDASPSGQCMPGIRWWAVWESDVTKGGGLRRAASVYAWYIRHYVQGWAWNVFLIQDMRMPNSDSSVEFWETIKPSGYFFIGRTGKCLPVIWPVINCHLVMCQSYCSYLQLKYFSMLK